MNKYVRKLLSPLFNAVAWPGIRMPHDGYTPDLLLAGVKPMGFPEAKEMHQWPELDAAVKAGRLISLRVERSFSKEHLIFTRPGISAAEIAKALDACPNEVPGKFHFFPPAVGITLPARFSGTRAMEDHGVDVDFEGQLADFMANRIDAIAADKQYMKHGQLYEQFVKPLEAMVAAGKASVLDHKSVRPDNSLVIYGQPGQADNMRRLEKTIKDGGEDRTLEGTLLGYTRNDVNRRWYATPGWKQKIMVTTEPLRRWCRAQAMLAKAP